ncbi:MAG TPA: hypothetical protein VJR03_12930 [Nitrospira sp.]|nr:hypothetical protein [Nitrospira sp.]
MRIKKKAPKPSAKRPPLYLIGYRGACPLSEELALWFDSAYGGPLKIVRENGAPESWHVSHGPWTAHVVIPLPSTHSAGFADHLSWEHDKVGAVAPSVMPPRDMPDSLLLAARLARGLTLLTQGTAHDIATQQYLNPSDWNDRALSHFVVDDHVLITEDDQGEANEIWCYTLGLTKFGIDELETFFPRGISDRAAKELLAETASELIRLGQSPKVGTALSLPILNRTVTIAGHRTAAPTGRMMGFRHVKPTEQCV